MRKEAKGILKSLPAPSRPFGYSFQLSKIRGKEGEDLIGLTIVERANHNGICRKERHKKIPLNRLIVQTVHIVRLMLLTVLTTYQRIVEIFPIYSPSPSDRVRVAAGSGSAPQGLLPRRESLWLGEGWTTHLVPLPFTLLDKVLYSALVSMKRTL